MFQKRMFIWEKGIVKISKAANLINNVFIRLFSRYLHKTISCDISFLIACRGLMRAFEILCKCHILSAGKKSADWKFLCKYDNFQQRAPGAKETNSQLPREKHSLSKGVDNQIKCWTSFQFVFLPFVNKLLLIYQCNGEESLWNYAFDLLLYSACHWTIYIMRQVHFIYTECLSVAHRT